MESKHYKRSFINSNFVNITNTDNKRNELFFKEQQIGIRGPKYQKRSWRGKKFNRFTMTAKSVPYMKN